MREPDLEVILDECLHNVSTRGESIERCLRRYPQQAGQLAPLVQVADRIGKTRHPTLSVSATKAIEQRLLKRATEIKQSKAKPSRWPLPFSLRPLVTVAATLIVVLALVLAGGGWHRLRLDRQSARKPPLRRKAGYRTGPTLPRPYGYGPG